NAGPGTPGEYNLTCPPNGKGSNPTTPGNGGSNPTTPESGASNPATPKSGGPTSNPPGTGGPNHNTPGSGGSTHNTPESRASNPATPKSGGPTSNPPGTGGSNHEKIKDNTSSKEKDVDKAPAKQKPEVSMVGKVSAYNADAKDGLGKPKSSGKKKKKSCREETEYFEK
ncbi:hypothetical protein ABG067_008641, partial [Albugo candida]